LGNARGVGPKGRGQDARANHMDVREQPSREKARESRFRNRSYGARRNCMNFSWHDAVGAAGVSMVLLTYLLLQMEKLKAQSPAYSLSNALGALLVLVSLSHEFNLSAFVIESVWLLVSLYGFVRFLIRERSRGHTA